MLTIMVSQSEKKNEELNEKRYIFYLHFCSFEYEFSFSLIVF